MTSKAQTLRILIAESDLTDVVLLREFISVANLGETDIRQAGSLLEAIAALEAESYDLILLSLRLPDVSGLPALSQLLRDVTNPPAVVVVGSRENRLEASRALQNGAQDLLVKGDFEPRILRRIVHTAVDRHRNQTALARSRRREAFLSNYHPLTELPNRATFRERLSQALAAAQHRQRFAAVLVVDLDRFEKVNDSLGCAAGDKVLREVAQRLRALLRSSDTLAHLSGDEFGVVLGEVTRKLDAARFAHQICEALHEPLVVDRHEVTLGASVGIAIWPEDGNDPDELLRNAGAARSEAKRAGRNTHRFYAAEMNARSLAQVGIESDLRRAIDRDELALLYQPIVDAETGHILRVEALLRWRRGSRLVPASEFLPVAEACGLIRTLDEWVLRRSCLQLARWELDGLAPNRLCVNVSPTHFWDSEFSAVVDSTLADTRIAPTRLGLELSARGLNADARVALAGLEKLSEKGVDLSIDGMGIGATPLPALIDLPLRGIKIDPAVIGLCQREARETRLTSALIALAGSLDLEVVAVGVEEPEQRTFLLERGCSAMQGCMFAPPLEAEELGLLLRRGRVPFDAK